MPSKNQRKLGKSNMRKSDSKVNEATIPTLNVKLSSDDGKNSAQEPEVNKVNADEEKSNGEGKGLVKFILIISIILPIFGIVLLTGAAFALTSTISSLKADVLNSFSLITSQIDDLYVLMDSFDESAVNSTYTISNISSGLLHLSQSIDDIADAFDSPAFSMLSMGSALNGMRESSNSFREASYQVSSLNAQIDDLRQTLSSTKSNLHNLKLELNSVKSNVSSLFDNISSFIWAITILLDVSALAISFISLFLLMRY